MKIIEKERGKLFGDLMEKGDEVYSQTQNPKHPGRGVVISKRNGSSVWVNWATGEDQSEINELGSYADVAARGGNAPKWEFPFEVGELFGVLGKADLLEVENLVWCAIVENWTIKVKGQKWQWITSPLAKFIPAEENVANMLAR